MMKRLFGPMMLLILSLALSGCFSSTQPQTLAEYRRQQMRVMTQDQTTREGWPNWATAPGGESWRPSYFGIGYFREQDSTPF